MFRSCLCGLMVGVASLPAPLPQNPDIPSLQDPHLPQTPSSLMQKLTDDCRYLNIDKIDVYGDFTSTKRTSYLRQFEADLAEYCGKEDAVFMPSGVMAQSIALLIHHSVMLDNTTTTTTTTESSSDKGRFACHHSSHLLLHENEGFRHLLSMEPLIISTKPRSSEGDTNNSKQQKQQVNGGGDDDDNNDTGHTQIGIPPLSFSDVKHAIGDDLDDEDGESLCTTGLSTLILELPHRELGGKLTSWDDVKKMKTLCAERRIRFHCDGARIFEASAGYGLTVAELCDPFDSVYLSFYKGLGGIAGAMLLGDSSFCAEARIWLRRFGGNLYTLLPYAISGWAGYRRQVTDNLAAPDTSITTGQPSKQGEELFSRPQRQHPPTTFVNKRDKMRRVVSLLSNSKKISQILSFDPPVPQVNMVHGYIRGASAAEVAEVRDAVERDTQIRVLLKSKVRDIGEDDPAYQMGYRCKFEYVMGDYNGGIDDDVFLRGWSKFASILLDSKIRQ